MPTPQEFNLFRFYGLNAEQLSEGTMAKASNLEIRAGKMPTPQEFNLFRFYGLNAEQLSEGTMATNPEKITLRLLRDYYNLFIYV